MNSKRTGPGCTQAGDAAAAPCDGTHVSARELAGQPLPERGRWLLAVTCAHADGDFHVQEMPGLVPRAFGGDVLIRITGPESGSKAGTVRAEVWIAAAGALIAVAAWDDLAAPSWPERIRPAVAFAMVAMTAIGRLIDLGRQDPVPVDPGLSGSATGLPIEDWLPKATGGE